MYIRSIFAVSLVSLSLVGSIPIAENRDNEVDDKGVKPHAPAKHAPEHHHPDGHKDSDEPTAHHRHPAPHKSKPHPKDKKKHSHHEKHGPVAHKDKPKHHHPAPHKNKSHPKNKKKHSHPAKHAHHPVAHKGKGKPKPHHPAQHDKKPRAKKNGPKKGKHSPHKPNKHAHPKKQSKAPKSPPQITVPQYDPNDDPEAQARAANEARQSCKAVSDCHCPAPKNANAMHSTSCINGFCSCDNPAIQLVASKFIDAVAAVGNASITKAVSQLMQGIADAKEVAGTIAGAFLGPEAKLALKAALKTVPDTGPSHIDQAAKATLMKVL